MSLVIASSSEGDRAESIRAMLLSAPKERRLDLAVGSLLYDVQREHIQIVDEKTRKIIPIWYFYDPVKQRRVFYYKAQARAWKPQTRPGERYPDPVPAYISNPAASQELRAWITNRSGEYTLAHGKEFRVTITRGTDRKVISDAAPRDPGRDTDSQICVLFVRAAVSLFAPELTPLLNADEPPDAQRPQTFLDWVPCHPAQELVFVPVFVPRTSFERRCQHQEYDLDKGLWHFCQQEWREKKDDWQPDQCPCCGGYFCERHYSKREVWFDTGEEKKSAHGPVRQLLEVCQTCALLAEEDILRLRETRLLSNRSLLA
jgi:hypothetical protein